MLYWCTYEDKFIFKDTNGCKYDIKICEYK